MDETIPGKVPREGTSEQTNVMPCKIQSFSSNAIYAEGCLIFLSSSPPPPLFFTWIPPAGSKNLPRFFAGVISYSISIFHLHIVVLCEENSPCQQDQAFHKWVPEWSSLLIPSADRLCFTSKRLGGKHKGPHCVPKLCAVICPCSSDPCF